MGQRTDDKIEMSYHEVATALIKASGPHEGHWKVLVGHGPTITQQATFSGRAFPGNPTFMSCMVPIVQLGLIRVDEPDALSVDAKLINPDGGIILPGGAVH